MIIDDKIRNENLLYDINRKAAKISALSLGKIINMSFFQVKKKTIEDQVKKTI